MQQIKKAILTLENGIQFVGKSFGYEMPCSGEVVFNTAMTGYPESLSDPSYLGQILVTTYPILGNYGVPPYEVNNGICVNFESEKIHCKAIICQDYSWDYSHWQATRSLSEWLIEEKVVGLYDIDTRAITKIIRDKGAMLGKITFKDTDDVPLYDPNSENLVAKASCKEVIEYGAGDKTVVLVDCGVKHNIIRCLVGRGVKVIRVPWDYDFSKIAYDGLFISNGPGNQILSMAAGAKTYKLKYGHRGHNQPVRKVGTNKCYITSQNHGFAVDSTTIPSDWEELFINMNDNSNEGIRHKSKPFFSAQFHPEACSGPLDTQVIFDDFISLL